MSRDKALLISWDSWYRFQVDGIMNFCDGSGYGVWVVNRTGCEGPPFEVEAIVGQRLRLLRPKLRSVRIIICVSNILNHKLTICVVRAWTRTVYVVYGWTRTVTATVIDELQNFVSCYGVITPVPH